MDLSDLDDDLQMLDELIFRTADYLRSASDEQPRSNTVTRIYSLPLALGGCGLFSYREIRVPARSAARDMATHQLIQRNIIPSNSLPVIHEETSDGPQLPTRQKERTRSMFQQLLPPFLQSLSEDHKLAFHDNGGKFGSAWLTTVPIGKYHVLTDRQVAAGLNIRVLQADILNRPVCSQCGGNNRVLHFETCPAAALPRQYRHDQIRDCLATLLKSQKRQVSIEPPIVNQPNAQRADLRIGTADGGRAMDPVYGLVDIKIKCALANDTAAARQAAVQPDIEPRQQAWNQIGAAMQVAANECTSHYAAMQPPPAQPVVPLVISSGGTLHKPFRDFLMVTTPNPELRRQFCVNVSLALLRARAAAYKLA
jgi:hypothetical protein